MTGGPPFDGSRRDLEETERETLSGNGRRLGTARGAGAGPDVRTVELDVQPFYDGMQWRIEFLRHSLQIAKQMHDLQFKTFVQITLNRTIALGEDSIRFFETINSMDVPSIERKFKSIENELDIIDGRSKSIARSLERKIGAQARTGDLKKIFCAIAAVYLVKRII